MKLILTRWEKCIWGNPRREGATSEWSARRLANAKRAVQREVDRTPLFPELARYDSVEDRVKQVDASEAAFHVRYRAHTAKSWRSVRLQLRQMHPLTAAGFLRAWNHPDIYGPREPSYFLDSIHQWKMGRHNPWRMLANRRRLQLHGQGRFKVNMKVLTNSI